jgi:hypothetical protein
MLEVPQPALGAAMPSYSGLWRRKRISPQNQLVMSGVALTLRNLPAAVNVFHRVVDMDPQLIGLAERTCVCSARDRDRLAAQTRSPSLGQIESAGQARSAASTTITAGGRICQRRWIVLSRDRCAATCFWNFRSIAISRWPASSLPTVGSVIVCDLDFREAQSISSDNRHCLEGQA